MNLPPKKRARNPPETPQEPLQEPRNFFDLSFSAYSSYCSLLPCQIPVEANQTYCCLNHSQLATHLSRNTIQSGEIFRELPWVQSQTFALPKPTPDKFSWIFYKQKPDLYHMVHPQTKLIWKLNPTRPVTSENQIVSTVSLTLQSNSEEGRALKYAQEGNWSFNHYQLNRRASLYCLSFVKKKPVKLGKEKIGGDNDGSEGKDYGESSGAPQNQSRSSSTKQKKTTSGGSSIIPLHHGSSIKGKHLKYDTEKVLSQLKNIAQEVFQTHPATLQALRGFNEITVNSSPVGLEITLSSGFAPVTSFFIKLDALDSSIKEKHLKYGTEKARGLEFNPITSNLLASGADDGETCIWDSAKASEPSHFPLLKGSGAATQGEISFASWNKKVQPILASTSYNGITVIQDLRKQKPLVNFEDSVRRWCSVLQWNPDIATQIMVASDDDSSPTLKQSYPPAPVSNAQAFVRTTFVPSTPSALRNADQYQLGSHLFTGQSNNAYAAPSGPGPYASSGPSQVGLV